MFFVFNKQKIYTYAVSLVTVIVLFFAIVMFMLNVYLNVGEYYKIQIKVIPLYEQTCPNIKDSLSNTPTYIEYMNIKNLIKTLLDIEVETDNLLELRENPNKYVTKKEDIEKLNDLFLLIDLLDRQEVE